MTPAPDDVHAFGLLVSALATVGAAALLPALMLGLLAAQLAAGLGVRLARALRRIGRRS